MQAFRELMSSVLSSEYEAVCKVDTESDLLVGGAEHNIEKDSFYGEFDVVGGALAGTTNTSTNNGSSRNVAWITEDTGQTQRINEKLKDSKDDRETIRHAEVTRADAAYAQLQHRFM